MGGDRVTIHTGRLAAFWAAIPHQIVVWEGEELYYVATLPLDSPTAAQVVANGLRRMLSHPIATGFDRDIPESCFSKASLPVISAIRHCIRSATCFVGLG